MASQKIIVTGSNGQLGREIRDVLEQRAPGQSTYVDIDELDLTDSAAVRRFLTGGEYTHLINCAAYTAVDRAEDDSLRCMAVNVDAVSNLARLSQELGFKILHFSTDYIFDGRKHTPYTESDKPAPLSTYGISKRKGETTLIGLAPDSMILRTGWLYSSYGHNFVKTILNHSSDAGRQLRVVFDQVGTPTYAADLAKVAVDFVLTPRWTPGIFNYSNEGVASWYDLAVAVLEGVGKHEAARQVIPILTADYPCAAARPHYSVLDKSRFKAAFSTDIPHWHNALRRCLDKIQAN